MKRNALMLWSLCLVMLPVACILIWTAPPAPEERALSEPALDPETRKYLENLYDKAARQTEGLDYVTASKKIIANDTLRQSTDLLEREPRAAVTRLMGGSFLGGAVAGALLGVVGQAQQSDDLFSISEALRVQNHLRKDGIVSISIDQEMEYGKPYEVGVAVQGIGDADPDTKKLKQIQGAFAAPTVMAEKIEFEGAQLRAQITAVGMEITESKGGWQGIEDNSVTVWTWSLVPKTSGKRTIFFHLDQKTDDLIFPVDTYPRSIEVIVSRTQQFVEWYDWAGKNVGSLIGGMCMIAAGLASVTTVLQYRTGQRSAEESKALRETVEDLSAKIATLSDSAKAERKSGRRSV